LAGDAVLWLGRLGQAANRRGLWRVWLWWPPWRATPLPPPARIVILAEALLRRTIRTANASGLGVQHLQVAVAQLAANQAALIPSRDGGYVLLALSRFAPSLFHAIPWSTDAVCGITRERLRTLGWSWGEQSPLADIDEPADLACLPLGLRAHLETCHGHRFTPAPLRQGPARQPAGGDSGAQ